MKFHIVYFHVHLFEESCCISQILVTVSANPSKATQFYVAKNWHTFWLNTCAKPQTQCYLGHSPCGLHTCKLCDCIDVVFYLHS